MRNFTHSNRRPRNPTRVWRYSTGLPAGVAAAGFAASLGLILLTLRLMGTNILVVSILHAAIATLLVPVIVEQVPLWLPEPAPWSYPLTALAVAAVLSLLLVRTFTPDRRKAHHA